MNEDMKLAVGILSAQSRSLKAFDRRYRADLEAAREHCREANRLGLDHDVYRNGVAASASRSLLSSLPSEPADARLDPHVQRILGHRDFGLSLLLQAGREDAWQVFLDRFGQYISSLFVRSGRTSDEARSLLHELVGVLRGRAGEVGAIAGYRGRSDMQTWLFCYVRSTFRGGFEASAEVQRRSGGTSTAAIPTVPEARKQTLDLKELARALFKSFDEPWEELAAKDRKLLAILAGGGTPLAAAASGIFAERNRSPDASQLAARHRQIVDGLFDRAFWGLVEYYRDRVDAHAVEEALHDALAAELDRRLMPVFGIEEAD